MGVQPGGTAGRVATAALLSTTLGLSAGCQQASCTDQYLGSGITVNVSKVVDGHSGNYRYRVCANQRCKTMTGADGPDIGIDLENYTAPNGLPSFSYDMHSSPLAVTLTVDVTERSSGRRVFQGDREVPLSRLRPVCQPNAWGATVVASGTSQLDLLPGASSDG